MWAINTRQGKGGPVRHGRVKGMGKILVIFAIAALHLGGVSPFVQGAQGEEAGYGPYPARLVRVIDGDTVEVDVALWPGLVQRIHVRLDGVNTPEKRGASACEKAAGLRATAFTQNLLGQARRLILSGVRSDKYGGRVLGRIHADGKDLADALLAAGLAKPYHGEKRGAWC